MGNQNCITFYCRVFATIGKYRSAYDWETPDTLVESVEHRLPMRKMKSLNSGQVKPVTYKIVMLPPSLLLGITLIGQGMVGSMSG